ncbi:MAG: hypothetical protein HY667_01455 [Chloroflexi bacterium]|nr:hypothetical protein [Chloroflexota bacterium]
MQKSVHIWLGLVLTAGILLAACAQPAQSPAPTTKPTVPATTTAPPKASPTPAATPSGAPQYGGVLRVSTGASPRSLIPEPNYIRNWFNQAAYDTLLKLDEKGELQPNLATEWKFSPDFKSLTLTLRKGVKFHDGTDFNAAAAKHSILVKQAAKLGDYEGVASVDIIDDYTLRLDISKFQNTLLSSMWFIAGLMHSPTAYQQYSKADAQWKPVGTGPFKFVRYDVNALIKFERFDGYWQKGKPYLDGFESVIIADATTRELALRKGEVHAAEGLGGNIVSAMQKDGWTVMMGPPEVYNTFAGDSANPDSPFANKKVREAVEYAIDREAVAKSLGYGFMQAVNQSAFSGTYPYVADLKGRSYDPAKAKQLLAEAGYPNGFKTTLLTIFSVADTLTAAQGYLKAVGIDGTIDLADSGRYYSLTQGSGWKNGLVYRARRPVPDWLSDINKELSVTSIDLKSTLRPPGFQDSLEKALAAPDTASRNAAAQQVTKKIFDDVIVVPLWGANYTIVRGKNVNNLDYYAPWGPNKLWGPADTWLSK